MSTCLSFNEIVSMGEPQVVQLKKVGDAYPSADAPNAYEAFSREVRSLESCVTETYKLAATITRRVDDLNEIAQVWDRMERFCTIVLRVLSHLKAKYPYCGTPELHDLTLDYKLACQKRYNNVLEEIECQKVDLPKGIFPETI